MINEQVPFNLTDRCDIYFEGSLISKEQIVKNYAEFLAASLFREERSVNIALHTGSVCFDIVSLITAALGCLYIDDFDSNVIIEQLENGDFVLYGENKQERYIWRGFANQYYEPVIFYSETSDNRYYAVLEQTTKIMKTFIPRNMWYLVTPYKGESQITDGRGLRKRDVSRNDFISYMFGVHPTEVPSVTGVSAIIVAKRRTFDRISKGLLIDYGGDKGIGLLDLITVSYYTDGGEEYQYGSNPANTEPVLKVTEKVSTARDLVLNKRGNKTAGFMVMGSENMIKGESELKDLLSRKSLRFALLTANIDFERAEEILEAQEDASIFACTKEFLLWNSLPLKEKNTLTAELDRQINNIVNSVVSTIIVDGGCSREDFRKVKEALYIIRKSDWNEGSKRRFIIIAYSLLNLFLTAVFPIEALEKASESGKLTSVISLPSARVRELWNLAENAGVVDEQCICVADILERLYKEEFLMCPKYDALKQRLIKADLQKTAVVVPKAYYIDILNADESINSDGITYVTANCFDNSEQYNEIIVIGDFVGKRFDPTKCRAASNITVLLYECETHRFKHKECKAENFERKLNSKLGITGDDFPGTDENLAEGDIDDEDMSESAIEMTDLEEYIDRISTLDIEKLAAVASDSVGTVSTSEVCAVGRFVSGEQILFSKYYTAVIFDAVKGTIRETDVENLAESDMLVFANRDDYTRNMVDYIYESLQISGRFSAEVLAAAEKAFYWKEILREYKEVRGFSYSDIAKELRRFGSSLREATIRQWLTEESHIVGPREEKTLTQIAEFTQDPHLLCDTHGYFNACRVVRRQRKEILELIGKAITDKLSGYGPPKGSILEVVYENVGNLSVILELENIFLLDEPAILPTNMINKPITEWEVIV